jgi:hypothetical protein
MQLKYKLDWRVVQMRISEEFEGSLGVRVKDLFFRSFQECG